MQVLETLITAAVQAPSGDNTQPWQFALEPDRRRITIDVDPGRDPSPMNAGQRMARIAVGAALENMLRTLERNRARAEWSVDAASGAATLDYPIHDGPLVPDEAIFARVTNRRVYEARPIPAEIQTLLLRQTADLSDFSMASRGRQPPDSRGVALPAGIAIHWLFDRNRLPELAEVIARADAALFSMREMRLALNANIRFEAGYREPVSEGLSLASLEMPRLAAPAFRFLTGLSDVWFRGLGGAGSFSRLARRLLNSASGLCVVTALDAAPGTDVLVGLALQRAWLALTEAGLAAQPMMTLPVLDSVLTQSVAGSLRDPNAGDVDSHRSSGSQAESSVQRISEKSGYTADRQLVDGLLARFHELVPELQSGRPAFLLRFGFAGPVSGRTGRLDWRAFCSWPSGVPQTEREALHV